MLRIFVKCLAGAAFMLSAQFAVAQQTPSPTPSQVLSQFPGGGPDMVAQVQNLLNSDRANLVAILAFAKTATEDQRKAIAQGLAGVAKAYAASDPAFATQIQEQVAASGIPELAKAYAEAAGDTGTASAGGAGGAGGGQVGNFPTGGQNNGIFTSSSPVPTTPSEITSGSLGGSTFVSNTTTTVQVSPF
jgi:hypothetical protein